MARGEMAQGATWELDLGAQVWTRGRARERLWAESAREEGGDPARAGGPASGRADSAGPARAPAGGECERDAGRARFPPSSGPRPTVRGVWESRKGRGVCLSRRSLEKGRCGNHSQPLAAERRALGWSSVSAGWPATPGRRCRCGWPSLRCGDAPLVGAPGARLRGGSPPASARRPLGSTVCLHQPPSLLLRLHHLSPLSVVSLNLAL